jgi:hypothetical protein
MQIIVTRPLHYKGTVYAADATIELDPLEAGAAIDSGRAVLADPADLERVNAAVAEGRDRLLDALNIKQQHDAANWILRRRQA